MVTLAINERVQIYPFGNVGTSILEFKRRGVLTSQGCKEVMIEKIASDMIRKKDKKEVVEFYYDFQKAYDNVNHAFLEKLLDVYGFPMASRSSSSR